MDITCRGRTNRISGIKGNPLSLSLSLLFNYHKHHFSKLDLLHLIFFENNFYLIPMDPIDFWNLLMFSNCCSYVLKALCLFGIISERARALGEGWEKSAKIVENGKRTCIGPVSSQLCSVSLSPRVSNSNWWFQLLLLNPLSFSLSICCYCVCVHVRERDVRWNGLVNKG